MTHHAAQSALGAGLVPLDPARTRYTLDSGRVVDVIPGKGRHMRRAFALTGGSSDQLDQSFALVSVLCRYDGRDLQYEEIDDLPMDDVAEMIAIIRGARKSDEEQASARANPKGREVATESPS